MARAKPQTTQAEKTVEDSSSLVVKSKQSLKTPWSIRIRNYLSILVTFMVLSALLLSIAALFTAITPLPISKQEHVGTNNGASTDISNEDEADLPGIEQAEQQHEQKQQEIEEEQEGENETPLPPPPQGQGSGNYWEYPATILPVTRSGDDLLVLVNKTYQLPSTYAPSDLQSVEQSGMRVTKSGLYLRASAVTALAEMNSAAKASGIDLAALSAYRSYATQASTYQYWVNYNGGSVDAADTVSARPGHSQHQLGTAIDFTTSEIGDQLGSQFGGTNAYAWLTENAWKYGFVISFPQGAESITGFNYEPWHYRYIGKENATEWKANGQILELWLRGKN